MKWSALVMIMISVILVVVTGTLVFYSMYVIKDVTKFDMYVEVSNKMGIVGDTDAVYFGTLMPGNIAKKRINISNPYSHPVDAIIRIEGEFAEWVGVDKPVINLDPNQSHEAIFVCEAPRNATHGNYTGEITITVRR